jgi:hypothetical protein
VRRSVATAITVGIGALSTAPAAGAAAVPSATLELNVSSSFAKAHGLQVGTVELNRGTAKDRRFTFGGSGDAALVAPFDLRLTHSPLVRNELELKNKGSRGTVLRPESYVVSKSKGTLTILFVRGGSRVTIPLVDVAEAGAIALRPDAARLVGRARPAKLTAAGAKQLNARLKVSDFKKGETVGTLSFVAERTVEVRSGTTTIVYDPAWINGLAACGYTASAAAPAEALPASPDAPAGGIRLPVAGGRFTAQTLVGVLEGHLGALRLQQAGFPAQDLRPLTFRLGLNGTTGVDVTSAGITFEFATVAGGARSKSLTAAGGTVTLTGLGLTLTNLPVQTMFSSCAGLPRFLGTASVTATVT